MSKTKSKNRKEIEYLRGVIRQLKSELKYYKKKASEDISELSEADCPSCGKGNLSFIDLLHVKFLKCNLCGYSEKNGKKTENR